MTVSLFGVDDALDKEDTEQARLEKALLWKLRKWGPKEEVVEGSNSVLESDSQEEAH